MSKMVVVAMFVVCVSAGWGWGHAQEMPPYVKAFLDNYTKDSTARRGPLELKKDGTIPDWVQIKDLKLRVIKEYLFNSDINLHALPDTVAFSEVIVPSNRWYVAVMAHDRTFCELILTDIKGKPIFSHFIPAPNGLSQHHVWGPLLKAYPESTGINPVLVKWPPYGHFFLYFKQFGPRKIYRCDRRFPSELDSLLPSSIETLDDSKYLIKYNKEYDIKKRAERAGLEKTKDDGKVKEKIIEPEKIFSQPASHPASRPAIYSIPALKREEAEAEHKKMFPAEDGK